MLPKILLPCAGLAGAMICAALSAAAEPGEYFRSKTITIYVSNPPGGGYDLHARLLAPHLGRHIPGNPAVVVSNMPGAQGITGANFLFNTAPRDGTALGALVSNESSISRQGRSRGRAALPRANRDAG